MYPQEMNIEHCRSCNAAIFFGITAKGKSMPIDAEPNYIDGNVLLVWQDGMVAMSDGLPCVRVASKANPAPEGADRYTSHFFTCPNAAFHRRRR